MSSTDKDKTYKPQNALVIDKWTKRLAFEESESSKLVDGEWVHYEDVEDIYCSLFAYDPRFVDECEDDFKKMFLQSVTTSPEYARVRDACRLSVEATSVCLPPVVMALAKLRRDNNIVPKEPEPEGDGMFDEESGEDFWSKGSDSESEDEDGAGESESDADDGEGEDDSDMSGMSEALASAVVEAATRAMSKASTTGSDYMAAERMVGGGMGGDGAVHLKLEPGQIKKFMEMMARNPALRRIFDRMGEFIDISAGLRRRKMAHGYDEIVGVVQSDDVLRALASEHVLAVIPALKFEFYRRIAEKQLICRKMETPEPHGKGPLVFVVDESGSMEGQNVEMAKGLALAAAITAKRQRRWICLVGFSGQNPISKPSPWVRKLVIPPGSWPSNKLIEWCSEFYSGGSNRDVPVVELPQIYDEIGCPSGKTDLIIVTDAFCEISDQQIAEFAQWRKDKKVKTAILHLSRYAHHIRDHRNTIMKMISDEVYDCTGSAMNLAIEKVLSL